MLVFRALTASSYLARQPVQFPDTCQLQNWDKSAFQLLHEETADSNNNNTTTTTESLFLLLNIKGSMQKIWLKNTKIDTWDGKRVNAT